ncbi:MAG TPA: hypothetical protein VIV88_18670 [Gemmatimonadales bacterium]
MTTLNLDKLKLAVGDLIERGNASSAHGDLRRYADDPLGFCRDVLDVDPWSKQEEIALAVRDHPQVHVRGANNLGKDAVAGWLALWWAYAREGLVLLTSASERQVREILMRREIGGAFRRAQLPGELLTTGLRVGEETRMLAFTSDDSSRYTGFHHPRVLALVSEAQGVDEAALEGLYTSAGGEQDRLVVYGNPVSPTGWFYRTSRPHTAWHKIQVSAFDLLGSGRRIPGAVTQAGVDRLAAEYGTDSPIYQARVLGEFPSHAINALVQPAWLERAAAAWDARTLEPDTRGKTIISGLDVARSEAGDASCLCVTQGPVVRSFHIWRESDTTVLRQRVEAQLRSLRVYPRWDSDWGVVGMTPDGLPPVAGRVVVDAHGLGGPVYDELKKQRWSVAEFSAAKRATEPDRFVNARAEAYWTLRQKLEQGKLALPRDGALFEELQAVTWTQNARQQIQVVAKDEIRASIGRSPDRADALVLALSGAGNSGYSGLASFASW